jgi:hypothetical protein
MITKIVEVTNVPGDAVPGDINGMSNWGKFMLCGSDPSEQVYKSALLIGKPLLWACGVDPNSYWVLDLQTGEGARFTPPGRAKYDLDKHKVWVCPMFGPFLDWLYENRINSPADFDRVPPLVNLPDAQFAMAGYRREGKAVGRTKSRSAVG